MYICPEFVLRTIVHAYETCRNQNGSAEKYMLYRIGEKTIESEKQNFSFDFVYF
jgi:hypothetical protein